jgi:hypothetical protein
VRNASRILAVATTVTLGLATLAAGAQSRPTSLPAPVTLAGVGGVKYGMTLSQVRRHWGRIAVVLEGGGSSVDGYAPVCGGPMRGAAHFNGPDLGPVSLNSVTFLKGARTDKNVGIGSSLHARQAAYGSQLIPDPNDSGYGYLVFDTSVRRRQPAIAFRLDDTKRRVERLSYGIKGTVGGDTVGGYMGLTRIDC